MELLFRYCECYRIARQSRRVLISLSFLGFLGVFGLSMNCAHNAKLSQKGLPPGQRWIDEFAILYIDEIPDIDRESWRLKIHGDVAKPQTLDYGQLLEMDTVVQVNDFHCVTGWSREKNHWAGVRLGDILALAEPGANARFVTFRGADGYETSLSLSECRLPKNLLAFGWEGKRLDKELGGPVRVVIPGKYGFKSTMWVIEMELTEDQQNGTWEKQGYSNTADPWKEERYAPRPALDR